jgi:Mg2+-importing ATPase
VHFSAQRVKLSDNQDFAPGDKRINEPDLLAGDRVWMGTSVVSGTGLVRVVATGKRTLFGQIAERVTSQRPHNEFVRGLRHVSFVFIALMAVVAPLVFLIIGLRSGDWLQAFLFTIAVCVGMVPEMLTLVVGAMLARSATQLGQSKTIVRRLEAIVTLGSMSILCTDKTGTLTQNRVQLLQCVDVAGQRSRRVLRYAYLNASTQTGHKNLVDVAIVEHVELAMPIASEHEPRLLGRWVSSLQKIDEMPFDFVRRRVSVLLFDPATGDRWLVTKGAMAEVLQVCSAYEPAHERAPPSIKTHDELLRAHLPRPTLPIDAAQRAQLTLLQDTFNAEGQRVVAVAYRRLARDDEQPERAHVEGDMTFLGMITLLDPPKASAAPAIRRTMQLGIEVKVLTGDTAAVCRKVCDDIGLPVRRIVTSEELVAASAAEQSGQLLTLATEGTIFARLTPLQKSQLIETLRSSGHVVGFMGDGINDSVALHQADVGISVAEAVDVAKEAADVILREKSLLVLIDGIVIGRTCFANIVKYVKMSQSSQFGNALSVTIAACWLPFLPMLSIHIVIQNLLYDISQLALPWDNVDAVTVAAPRRWSTQNVMRFLAFGPVSSLFDIATFFFLWFALGLSRDVSSATTPSCTDDPEHCTLVFQTGWFVSGLCTQALIIRTPRLPFIQSSASVPVVVMTALVMTTAIALPYTPDLNALVSMRPLPGIYFVFLVPCMLAYCITVQLIKIVYVCAFGVESWL